MTSPDRMTQTGATPTEPQQLFPPPTLPLSPEDQTSVLPPAVSPVGAPTSSSIEPVHKDWQLQPAAIAKYVALFEMAVQAEGAGATSLGKRYAGLHRSGLALETLFQIWTLSDMDRDDRLTLKEYLICCFLVTRCVKHALEPPDVLPSALIESATQAAEMNAAASSPMPDAKLLSDLFASRPIQPPQASIKQHALSAQSPEAAAARHADELFRSPPSSNIDHLFCTAPAAPVAQELPSLSPPPGPQPQHHSSTNALVTSTSFGDFPSTFGTALPSTPGAVADVHPAPGAAIDLADTFGGLTSPSISSDFVGADNGLMMMQMGGLTASRQTAGNAGRARLQSTWMPEPLDISAGGFAAGGNGNLLDSAVPENAHLSLPSGDALMPAAKAHAAAAEAMSALQRLVTATGPEQLQQAILDAQMVADVPMEALYVARKRLALLQANVGYADGGSMSNGVEYLQQQMQAMIGEYKGKMDMMASLQAKLEAMQLLKQQIEEENKQLKQGLGPRSRKSGNQNEEEEEEEDEQEREDRLAREGYAAAKAAVMEALSEGRMATAEQYLERDIHMYRLSDPEIQSEYGWYTQLYLNEYFSAAEGNGGDDIDQTRGDRGSAAAKAEEDD